MELTALKSQDLRRAFGFLKQEEFDALAGLVTGAQVIINIGAGVGTSAMLFREVCGDEAEIYTIDISGGSPTGGLENERNAFANSGLKLPRQILDDSARVGRDWLGPQADFVFVDGDHSEEQCRADIEAWLPHLKSGGVMAFHDYVAYPFQGVINAVDDLMQDCQEIAYVACLKAFRKP